jgi:O-acetyl-ADP-ribose deacetylase (regulator of RNase III)
MLIVISGSIFDSKMQTITNTVNCLGVSGKGLALKFKHKYPDYYAEYRDLCLQDKLKPGYPHLHKKYKPWILSFPTKEHWKNPSKLEWIETGLKIIAKDYNRVGIESIAIPALGCSNGGLNWEIVHELMIEILKDLPINIEIYEPQGV